MPSETPLATVELVWSQGLRFGASAGNVTLVVDGDGAAGPSPVQCLVLGLAGCMAIGVLDIVRRGHHPITGLRARLGGTRLAAPPRRVTTIELHFVIEGGVPAHAVERAVALSRDKYCSVWHSLRQDITLTTGFEIRP